MYGRKNAERLCATHNSTILHVFRPETTRGRERGTGESGGFVRQIHRRDIEEQTLRMSHS